MSMEIKIPDKKWFDDNWPLLAIGGIAASVLSIIFAMVVGMPKTCDLCKKPDVKAYKASMELEKQDTPRVKRRIRVELNICQPCLTILNKDFDHFREKKDESVRPVQKPTSAGK